jgi:hypothetical protein
MKSINDLSVVSYLRENLTIVPADPPGLRFVCHVIREVVYDSCAVLSVNRNLGDTVTNG